MDYEVEDVRPRGRPKKTWQKKIVRSHKCARKILWTVGNGES